MLGQLRLIKKEFVFDMTVIRTQSCLGKPQKSLFEGSILEKFLRSIWEKGGKLQDSLVHYPLCPQGDDVTCPPHPHFSLTLSFSKLKVLHTSLPLMATNINSTVHMQYPSKVKLITINYVFAILPAKLEAIHAQEYVYIGCFKTRIHKLYYQTVS